VKAATGMLAWVELGQRVPTGHEQEGRRPCVVIAVPGELHRVRFPVLVVAPMTTAALPSQPLYPRLSTGAGGLAAEGTVLLDQLLTVDVRRIKKVIGTLTSGEYQPVQDGVSALFGV
jgi:mRNA interferase MazF